MLLSFKKIINIFILLSFFLWQTDVFAAIHKAELDAKIKAFIQDKPIKGMIYGLWINGKPVSINALGESMTAVPATKDMHFRIGGPTETMLTTLLMKMVELKLIALNDKVAQWYPNLPNADRVTLKMLANGTSGYQDYVYNKKFDKINTNQPFKQWTDAALLEYTMGKSLFHPGAGQRYTHTDYVILGSILSKAAKKPIAELFQMYILKKLNMQNTNYNLTAVMSSPVFHSFSQDRSVYEDATFWDPSWTSSSGAIVSTIEDLGKWANAWMKGQLLTEKSTRQLRAPDTVGKGNNIQTRYFAMGFAVANHWLIQNPGFGGYRGIFAVLPEKNIVFIAYNTLQPTNEPTSNNFSMLLWEQLATELAPEYPLPPFK